MEEEKLLDNITKSIGDRLKVPIILTYICVLVLYNWDILFYLVFESGSASCKIAIIKETYPHYYYRLFSCLLIATVLIALFTILNTGLNTVLKWFYKKDKENTTDIENYETVKVLNAQLSQQIDTNSELKKELDNLQKINLDMASKNLPKSEISEISVIDYNKLIETINALDNKEKVSYSLRELKELFEKSDNIADIYRSATYSNEMKQLISILTKSNLITVSSYYNREIGFTYDRLKFELSMIDILEMEL